MRQILSHSSYSKKKGYFALVERVIEEVQFEIGQIDHLFISYATLFERARQIQPDLIETTAIASVLHSFYNGVENIFMSIAKRLDSQVPTGDQWHRKLLVQMSQTTAEREGVISTELAQRLANYLGFQHFYRHSYSFFLDWSELEKLVIPLHAVWSQVKTELNAFLDSLSAT
jgi:hypothetical protein